MLRVGYKLMYHSPISQEAEAQECYKGSQAVFFVSRKSTKQDSREKKKKKTTEVKNRVK